VDLPCRSSTNSHTAEQRSAVLVFVSYYLVGGYRISMYHTRRGCTCNLTSSTKSHTAHLVFVLLFRTSCCGKNREKMHQHVIYQAAAIQNKFSHSSAVVVLFHKFCWQAKIESECTITKTVIYQEAVQILTHQRSCCFVS
jgi:hypothetical protein